MNSPTRDRLQMDTSLDAVSDKSAMFVRKLWIIVNDAMLKQYIRWTKDGRDIWVPDAACFSKQVLPCYFKHGNWQSFVRQLNLYGFRKVSLPGSSCRTGWLFRHDYFCRDDITKLNAIQRRSRSKPQRSSGSQPLYPHRHRQPYPHPEGKGSDAPQDTSVSTANVTQRISLLRDMLQGIAYQSSDMHQHFSQLRTVQAHQREALETILKCATQELDTLSPSANDKRDIPMKTLVTRSDSNLGRIDILETIPRAEPSYSKQNRKNATAMPLHCYPTITTPESHHRRHSGGHSFKKKPKPDFAKDDLCHAKKQSVSLPSISTAIATMVEPISMTLPPIGRNTT